MNEKTDKKRSHIFLLGNEKGGVGKTTYSMHLICSLLYQGLKVASIDLDSRQKSLSSYIDNRVKHNSTTDKQVPISEHFLIGPNQTQEQECKNFEQVLQSALTWADTIVIDTPGSYSALSSLAHSYADTIITPVNDSFIDLDVLFKVDSKTLKLISPSIYSETIWNQKLQRANRDGGAINWIIVRNRLVNSYRSNNQKNVGIVLENIAAKMRCKLAPGFSERVIFKELFLHGLTLLDLEDIKQKRALSISHVAARQEMREFLKFIEL